MSRGSELYIEAVVWLGRLYDFLNENFFDKKLEKPVISIAPDDKEKFFGWFIQGELWKESAKGKGYLEINMSANFLNRPTIEIATTMLHEMCHQFAFVNDIKDTSRSGNYHNRLFSRIAENHGLLVTKQKGSGYSCTVLKEQSKSTIEPFVKDVKLIYRLPEFKGARIKSSSTRKYVCPNCQMSVRATKRVNIICADCNMNMQEEDM